MATKRVSTVSYISFIFSLIARIAWKVASGALTSSLQSSPRAKNGGIGSQWADEVLSAKDRTTITGEAKELEQEIELRKEGLHRCACSIPHSSYASPSLTFTDHLLVMLHDQGCNLPRNSTISQYPRKRYLQLSMTPTSFFPERRSESLWSDMVKILLMTLSSVTMASLTPSVHSR